MFEFLDVESRARRWFRIGRGGILLNLIQTGLALAGFLSWCVLDNREAWFDLLDGWTKNRASTMASYDSDG